MGDESFETAAWMPPENVIAAEQSVIGACIGSRAGADEAVDRLRATDFARPAHQVIFEAVAALLAENAPVAPTAVLDALTRSGLIRQAGGGSYLAEVYERACTPLQVGWYAERITRDWQRRRLAEVSAQGAQRAASPGFDPDEDLDALRGELDAITDRTVTGEAVWAADAIDSVIDRLGNPDADPGLPTGLLDLTELLGGLRAGQLVVIAARPSVGKSVLAGNIATYLALRENLPVLFHSLEMSRDEVLTRMISAEGRIPMSWLHAANAGQLTEEHWRRVADVRARVRNSRLLIDDTPGAGLANVRSRLREMARGDAARLAVVDYLQLMEGANRSENRQVEVAGFSRGLKLLAKEFNLPIIAVAQLNRGPEQRADKKPLMSDLRESGGIEADADVVILLHREDQYEKESPRAGEIDLIVQKNRNGPTATVTVAFQGHYARCVDMAVTEPPSDSPGLRAAS